MNLKILPKILISWGLFWGILGLVFYFLGLVGLYEAWVLIAVAIIFLIFLVAIFIRPFLTEMKIFLGKITRDFRKDRLLMILFLIFILFAVTNFIITLAPETGFDALWYHLTLPKIYLATHKIQFIKGGLLYYSVMPKLVEMFYGLGLAINPGGFLPKIIHYFFGIFWFLGTYLFARLFLKPKTALMAAVSLYGVFLVSWLSMTAYIDLAVAFFVVMALWSMFGFFQTRDNRFLYLAAIFMGFNLASKTYGLIIFGVLLMVLIFRAGWKKTFIFGGIALLIVLPFYLQAFLATGNPLYPLFSIQDAGLKMYLAGYNSLKDWYLHFWWLNLPALFWQIVIYRFTPVLGIVLLVFFAKGWKKISWLIIILIGFFVIWSLLPVQELRYFLPILPVLGTIVFFIFENINWLAFRTLVIILFISGLSFNYLKIYEDFRQTISVSLGKMDKTRYLTSHLYFPQTFYDVDHRFSQIIQGRRVLTFNIHNLFYVDFPFTDWTFVEENFNSRPSAEDLAVKLKNLDIDYVLIGAWDTEQWSGLPKEEMAQNFSLVLSANYFNLYKIKP